MTHLWKPIADAPRDRSAILVFVPRLGPVDEYLAIARWCGRGWALEHGAAVVPAGTPSHWMELPEVP